MSNKDDDTLSIQQEKDVFNTKVKQLETSVGRVENLVKHLEDIVTPHRESKARQRLSDRVVDNVRRV